jgi:catechol 2,3-dioxygenase-like lactoylglutathione lyase family enzyme
MKGLVQVAVLVRDYDEAIAYYTEALGFALIEDTPMSPTKRWVVLAPNPEGARVLLARAANPEQERALGKQFGGRVGFFLHTDDFERDYARMSANNVRFIESPRDEAYGRVIVFEDLYGNRWDLIEPKAKA